MSEKVAYLPQQGELTCDSYYCEHTHADLVYSLMFTNIQHLKNTKLN